MSQMSREQLLGVVRRVYDERDPMPEGLIERMQEAAHAEAAGLGLDLELMLLVEESDSLAGARSEDLVAPDFALDPGTRHDARGAAYTLQFALGEIDLLVRVASGESHDSRIDGWMAPAEEMTVRVLAANGPSRATTVSETGRFEFTGMGAGLLRLRFEPHDRSRPPFATPGFEI